MVLIGDSNVGKSSLIPRWLEAKNSDPNYTPTTKTVPTEKTTSYRYHFNVILKIWDTPGTETDESFEQNTAIQYKEADAFIICFDVTNKESFDNIENKWIPKINKYNDNNCSLMILGIKSDLEDQRVVSKEEGEKYAISKNINYQEVFTNEYCYYLQWDSNWVKELYKSMILKKYFIYLRLYDASNS